MVGVDFDQGSAEFLAWFRGLPGASFHDNIRITDLRCRNAGRGIVATADIEADTVLFTIPRKDIICLANSELSRKLDPSVFASSGPQPLDNDNDEQGEGADRRQNSWTSLILVMMYEHLRGAASPWKPYLDILPTKFDTPMFWSDAEVAELQASPVLASIGKAEADAMIRGTILPVIKQNAAVFGDVPVDEQLMELAHRMGSTIMAYAFDLENEDEADEDQDGWVEDKEGTAMMGMVPMADMLNADAEFNAHINHSEEALAATALRKISAGEEILNYYGPLPNGQLLRRYGYVTPKHSRYDVVELGAATLIDKLLSQLNLGQDDWGKIAREHAGGEADSELVDMDEVFTLERSCEDPDEFGQLQGPPPTFSKLPEDLVDMLKTVIKAAKGSRPDLVPGKKARDRVMHAAVRDAVDSKLAEYATSLQDDLDKLAASPRDGGSRARMALEVRIGEKRLLHEIRAWLAERLGEGESTNGGMEVDEPSAKRRRRK